jgi:hypothetical protein
MSQCNLGEKIRKREKERKKNMKETGGIIKIVETEI